MIGNEASVGEAGGSSSRVSHRRSEARRGNSPSCNSDETDLPTLRRFAIPDAAVDVAQRRRWVAGYIDESLSETSLSISAKPARDRQAPDRREPIGPRPLWSELKASPGRTSAEVRPNPTRLHLVDRTDPNKPVTSMRHSVPLQPASATRETPVTSAPLLSGTWCLARSFR